MADVDAESIERQMANAMTGRGSRASYFNTTSLRLFASVVEHSNIAKASRVNNIAASAVSKRISDLEARFGVALLYRVKDGMEPTTAGRALARHVKRILRLMEEMGAELSEYVAGNRGQVRLWANTSAVTQLDTSIRFRVKALSFDAIRRMVEAGLGLAVLPVGAIVPYLQDGTFVAARLDEPWATRTLILRYRNLDSLPVIARGLVECLASEDGNGTG